MRYGWVNRSDAVGLLARSVQATVARVHAFQERRRCGRFRSGRSLTCNLGAVLDLSRGGLRVVSRRRLEGERLVELFTVDRRLRVPANVIWCDRVGFRKHVVGLEFPASTPELAHHLMAFATA